MIDSWASATCQRSYADDSDSRQTHLARAQPGNQHLRHVVDVADERTAADGFAVHDDRHGVGTWRQKKGLNNEGTTN